MSPWRCPRVIEVTAGWLNSRLRWGELVSEVVAAGTWLPAVSCVAPLTQTGQLVIRILIRIVSGRLSGAGQQASWVLSRSDTPSSGVVGGSLLRRRGESPEARRPRAMWVGLSCRQPPSLLLPKG